MAFLVPLALLFGLALPVILLLWLLKRRRQEHQVSSTYLWRQVLRDVRANAPWQRLVAHLLLILQLVAAALFALAMARPHLLGPGAGRSHLVLVLDVSGSMRTAIAESGGTTRFDRAQQTAAAALRGLASRDRASVVLAGRIPQMAASGAEPRQAAEAVAAARATYESADWGQALSMAASAARNQPGARIHIISDAAVEPAVIERLGVPATSERIGDRAENLSIRISVRAGAGGASPAALGRVTNYGREQAAARIEFLADGLPIDERDVAVPPEGSAEIVWQDLPAGATRFTARIANPDALAADNAANAVLQQTGRAKALLVTQANLFLDQALRLREDLEVVRTTPDNYAPGPYQLYVFDGYLPSELPAGALLLVAPPPQNPFIPLKAVTPVTGVRPGARAGALTAYVPLDDVHVARARPLDPPAWANVLLEAPEGPLLAAGHQDGRPVAVMGFDIHESDFPLRIGFPVLMQNLLNWLVPTAPSSGRALAGEPVALALDPLATGASVISPDGRSTRVAPPFPAPAWSATATPGVYTLVQTFPEGERTSRFVVEFPGDESGVQALTLAPNATTGPGSARAPLQEIWPWLVAFALLVIAAEWWVYIRGT